ncbi:MAG: SCP2 sterol-binding domain-containing protein [Proteobacteria bacterium]|nr:SCP2 sterol-binding domain-containing protein [Pseudomonadota bacterium]MBU1740415.1 SCP2 sterol-binding domain-containing protein [Pseudomonadota bacterium]
MSQELAYLSQEWAAEALRRLQAELTPEQMKFLSTSMSNRYRNCPDGQDRFLFFRCEDGRFIDVTAGQGEPPPAEFRITGDYEVFARISRAELKSQRALMTGKLRLKGNMVKALKLASIADRMNKVLSKIPTTY